MMRKFAAAVLANARRQSSHLIPRASAAQAFTLAGATATAKRPLRFNMVLFTMDNIRQCLVSVTETARGFSASAHADSPYTHGSFSFPGIPGMCTVAGAGSTSTSYVVGGLSAIPDCDFDSNLLFSLDSADLMPPPAPTAYGFDTIIFPPWKNLASLKNNRVKPAVVPLDGKLFIFGGCYFNQSWLEIFDTITGRVIESRDLPDHLPSVEYMVPNACFLWDGLFMVNCDYPTSRLYSYSLQDDVWELFDDNFPSVMIGCRGPRTRRNLLPVGRDKLFIIDRSDLWLVYDLSSRQKVEVRVEGMPNSRHVLQAFICSSADDESWIIRLFMIGEDAGKSGMAHEDDRYACNMPYARVRVRRQGENFVTEVESLAEMAVDPYMEGTMIFPLQKLQAEVEE